MLLPTTCWPLVIALTTPLGPEAARVDPRPPVTGLGAGPPRGPYRDSKLSFILHNTIAGEMCMEEVIDATLSLIKAIHHP